MGICHVWEDTEKLRQAFKTELFAFESVNAAVTAIDSVWWRCNVDCCCRKKLQARVGTSASPWQLCYHEFDL